MTYKEANEVLKRWKCCKENRFDDFCKQKRTCIGCEYEYEDEEVKEAIKVTFVALEKQSELEKGIEDLRDTLNDAYALNDFVLNKMLIGKPLTEAEDIAEMFSIKAMQNLSWLLAVIDGSDNE